MALSKCSIPVGKQDDKPVKAVMEGGGSWPRIIAHVEKHGAFQSPDHFRQVFPGVKFTTELVEDAQLQTV